MTRNLKKRITISISPRLLKWIDECIDEGLFTNRSNAAEFCVLTISELTEEELIRMKMKRKKKKD